MKFLKHVRILESVLYSRHRSDLDFECCLNACKVGNSCSKSLGNFTQRISGSYHISGIIAGRVVSVSETNDLVLHFL